VHEWPYLVKGDKTVLKPGMTFSNEPTICIYGEFGVRLEDTWSSPKPAPAGLPSRPIRSTIPSAWRSNGANCLAVRGPSDLD